MYIILSDVPLVQWTKHTLWPSTMPCFENRTTKTSHWLLYCRTKWCN